MTSHLRTTRIFMPNEGTDCWRPVNAKEHSEGVFEIVGIMPAGEEWQFVPGTTVHCRPTLFTDGSTSPVAFELAIDQP
jgi:hypothetical protein